MMAAPRIFSPVESDHAWAAGVSLRLTGTAARHIQVLRLQPGSCITLFNGDGGQWQARIIRMGRQEVDVVMEAHQAIECELPITMTLAVVIPANDRMDDLVEKATELGVAGLQPLMSERSVLRLSGERAAKKVAHWQSVAQAACEQCGRNRVPRVHSVMALSDWLQQTPHRGVATRWVLSTHPDCLVLPSAWALHNAHHAPLTLECLSGPEGGFSVTEIHTAVAVGFNPISLGARILRADTAPLAALAAVGVMGFSASNAQKTHAQSAPLGENSP